MRLSASIVTYNSISDVGGAIESLRNSDCFEDIDIYVIDNCSNDGTTDHVRQNYPFVTVIENDKNGGYGYGHNKVLEAIDSEIHFIVNPDITFGPTLISGVVSFLRGAEEVSVCTPEMLTEKGEFVFPPKSTPRIRYIIARFFGNIKIFSKWRDEYTMKEKVTNNDGKPFDIEFCSGAFMAIRTEVFKKVKGFDECFFLYYEDADLTRRLLKYGRCVCLPNLSVIHEGKREAYHSTKIRKIMIRSMMKYFLKWAFR